MQGNERFDNVLESLIYVLQEKDCIQVQYLLQQIPQRWEKQAPRYNRQAQRAKQQRSVSIEKIPGITITENE